MSTVCAVPRKVRKALKEYAELREQRLELSRKADNLRRLEDQAAEVLTAAVRSGGPIVAYGLTAELVDRPCQVSWKDEFLAVAGSKAADRIMAHRPTKEVLVVSK